jgi:hypothetical protein
MRFPSKGFLGHEMTHLVSDSVAQGCNDYILRDPQMEAQAEGSSNARNGTGQGVLAAGAGTHTRPELGCQTATRSAAMISINLKSRGTIALLPLSLRAVMKTRTQGRRHYREESALSGWSANRRAPG